MRTVLLLVLGLAACDPNPYPDYWSDPSVFPRITGVEPASVSGLGGGQTLHITGTELFPARTVVIGGRNATIVAATETSVDVLVPEGAPGGGAVDVSVVTDAGFATAEGAFTWSSAGADWWGQEVASASIYQVECPSGIWSTDPKTGEYNYVWWCGMEMGYGYGYGFDGAGFQPGFAADLAEIAELSTLPPLGEVRTWGPGEPRTPAAAYLYGTHPDGESVGFTTPRDLERDLSMVETFKARFEDYYTWYDSITTWYDPYVVPIDADGCCYANPDAGTDDTAWCQRLPIASATGDQLTVDGTPPGATEAVRLGMRWLEEGGGDTGYWSYEGVASFGSASVTGTSGSTWTLGPSGTTLEYDGWSGWYFPQGAIDGLYAADVPWGEPFQVVRTRLDEVTELGEIRSVEPVADVCLTGKDGGCDPESNMRPLLLSGDVRPSRTQDLQIHWTPRTPDGTDDPSYVVVDLRVYDADVVDPYWMTEVYRIVVQGDDTTGSALIPATALEVLPAVWNDLDEQGDLTGYWAELTVARHQLRKVPLSDEGDLVVDFLYAVSGIVTFR